MNMEINEPNKCQSNEIPSKSVSEEVRAETIQNDSKTAPRLLMECFYEFSTPSNNVKKIVWSEKSDYILSASDDKFIRIFAIPSQFENLLNSSISLGIESSTGVLELTSIAHIKCYSFIYDILSIGKKENESIVVSSKGNGIHIWDLHSQEYKTSLVLRDHVEEPMTPVVLGFNNPDELFGGFYRQLAIFDLNKETVKHIAYVHPNGVSSMKQNKLANSSKTLVSAIGLNKFQNGDTFAYGCYNSQIYVQDIREKTTAAILSGHSGGITDLTFRKDPNYLISGARNDNNIYCWDLRKLEVALNLIRSSMTTQRMLFDLNSTGDYLASGAVDGSTSIFDLNQNEMYQYFGAHFDSVSCAAFHNSDPNILGTCSGSRHYSLEVTKEQKMKDIDEKEESDDFSESNDETKYEGWLNGIRIWKI